MLPRGVLQLQPRDILGPGLEHKANFRYGFDLTCWSVPVLVRARLGRICSISQDCKPSAVHRRPLLRSTLFFGRRCGPARMADQAARQRRRLEITSPIGMSAIQVLRLEAASPFPAPKQTVAERILSDFSRPWAPASPWSGGTNALASSDIWVLTMRSHPEALTRLDPSAPNLLRYDRGD